MHIEPSSHICIIRTPSHYGFIKILTRVPHLKHNSSHCGGANFICGGTTSFTSVFS